VKILACDTALGALSAAVLDDDGVLASEFVAMSRGHAEELAPMAARVMKAADVGFKALDRLAVTTGPGTFTGQRVGLAFMRAARLALNVPLIGITTLEAMAVEALDGATETWAAVASDAKRGEVYLGAHAGTGETILPARLLPADEAVARLAAVAAEHGAPVLAGTAAEAMRTALADAGTAARVSGITQPHAIWVAQLARVAPVPETPPKPLYLRAPDAKLPR
jgi:tRNA threonylcarbamoyladenosine biosynthesis protein TsaB